MCPKERPRSFNALYNLSKRCAFSVNRSSQTSSLSSMLSIITVRGNGDKTKESEPSLRPILPKVSSLLLWARGALAK